MGHDPKDFLKITNFTFVNNWSPVTTDIIVWLSERQGNLSSDISQCTFRDHVCKNASIIRRRGRLISLLIWDVPAQRAH